MTDRSLELAAIPALWSRADAAGWNRARHIVRQPVVERVALDADGSHLIAAGAGHLFAYDVRSGEELGAVALGDGSEGGWAMTSVFTVAFTPDGARVVVGEARYTEDPNAYFTTCWVHDARTLARERPLAFGNLEHADAGGTRGTDRRGSCPAAFASSPDGEHIALADGEGMLQILSATTGRVVAEPLSPDELNTIQGMVFSPDGKRLGIAWSLCAIAVLDVPTGRVICKNDQIESRGEIALGFSADGKQLIVASDSNLQHDSVAQVVTVQSGKLRKRSRLREALIPLRVDGARAEVLWRPHARSRHAEPHWLYRQDLTRRAPLVSISLPPVALAAVTDVAVSGDGTRIAIAAGTRVMVATLRR